MKNTQMSLCHTKANLKGSKSLLDILNSIHSNEYQQRITKLRETIKKYGKDSEQCKIEKENLLAFTPSGIFKDKRANENLTTYSQIMVLDIDHLVSMNKAEEIKKNASGITETLAAFISPSGLGVKIIVKVNCDSSEHTSTYEALIMHYEGILNIKCDDKCKDLSRCHYFSYDPLIFINWDSQTFNPPLMPKKLVKEDFTVKEKIKYAETWINKKVSFTEGSRNDYVFRLACELNRYGLLESETLHYLINKYTDKNFGENEISASVKGVYTRYKDQFGQFKGKPKKFENLKKEYDYAALRTEFGLNKASELNVSDFIGYIFYTNSDDTERSDMLGFLLEDLPLLTGAIQDVTLLRIVNLIISNTKFDNNFFFDHSDECIKTIAQTLFDTITEPSNEIVFRATVAEFKANYLYQAYENRLKESWKLPQNSNFKQQLLLNEISVKHQKHAQQVKAFLEELDDNRL